MNPYRKIKLAVKQNGLTSKKEEINNIPKIKKNNG